MSGPNKVEAPKNLIYFVRHFDPATETVTREENHLRSSLDLNGQVVFKLEHPAGGEPFLPIPLRDHPTPAPDA